MVARNKVWHDRSQSFLRTIKDGIFGGPRNAYCQTTYLAAGSSFWISASHSSSFEMAASARNCLSWLIDCCLDVCATCTSMPIQDAVNPISYTCNTASAITPQKDAPFSRIFDPTETQRAFDNPSSQSPDCTRQPGLSQLCVWHANACLLLSLATPFPVAVLGFS